MRRTFAVMIVGAAAACSRAEDLSSSDRDGGAEASSSWTLPDASAAAEAGPPANVPQPCPCDAGGEVVLRFGDAAVPAGTLAHAHEEPACITSGASVSDSSCGTYLAACAGPDHAPPCLALSSFRGGAFVEADGGSWILADGAFEVLPDADAGTATGTFAARAIRSGCAGAGCETDVRGTFHTCSDWLRVTCE